MNERAWGKLRAWSTSIDERDDITDEARRWADDEAHGQMPKDGGELRAMLSIAFEAGRRWERIPWNGNEAKL